MIRSLSLYRAGTLSTTGCALMLATLTITSTGAADYPQRPLRVLTPFSAGSITDVAARAIAMHMNQTWDVPVVVDNRPGGGGAIAAELTAKAAPDGYTLLVAATGPTVINPSLLKDLPYDSRRAFAPITLTGANNMLLAVAMNVPARSVKELLDLAKSKPGQLRFASPGIGSTAHLAGELLKSMAGIDIIHVPYKGSPQYVVDLLAGRIDMSMGAAGPVIPHGRAGRLRLLGVGSAKRDPTLSDVPTIAEAGVPGFEVVAWSGLLTTAGTPAPVVNKLHHEIIRVLTLPDVKQVYATVGMEVLSSASPAEFAAYVAGEREKWAKVIKAANIHID